MIRQTYINQLTVIDEYTRHKYMELAIVATVNWLMYFIQSERVGVIPSHFDMCFQTNKKYVLNFMRCKSVTNQSD